MIRLVLVSLAVIAPTLVWGIPSNRDLSNHFRFALPFYDALGSGHLHPGWLAESNSGYGDASFRFYPPALYYLLAVARALTGDWYPATLLTFAMLSVLGALGIYFWACELMPSRWAMWAGIFFALAPYHLNQVFQAFMLAEFAGAAVLPFAFAFAERICAHRRPGDIAGFAAAYAILILTHLPLAVIGSIALLVYALIRLNWRKRWATIGCLSLSAALGLAASTFYWTTMFFELNWIRADTIDPDPSVDYRANFVLSTLSPDNLNVWWMNILLLSSVAMFWPAIILLRRSGWAKIRQNSNRDPRGITASAGLLFLTIFMATPLSRPLWNLTGPLQQTQFPWRWLAIASMVSAILLATAIPGWIRLATSKKRSLVLIAVGTAAISFAFSLAHIVREAKWLSPSAFQQTLAEIPGSRGVYQWWPVWVKEPFKSMPAPVDAGDRKLRIDLWEPELRIFHLNAGQPTDARVRTFFYPHWKASANGHELSVYPDQDGTLMIALPKEAATVSLEFREPNRTRYAVGLTLLAWGLIGGLVLKRFQTDSKEVELVG